MQVRIETLNGAQFVSDAQTLTELHKESGSNRAFITNLEGVIKVVGSLGSLDTLTLTINDRNRGFQAKQILWAEIDWQGENPQEFVEALPEDRSEVPHRRPRPSYR